VDVSSLFDFTDSVKNGISLDSSLVQPYLTAREKKKLDTFVPGFIEISYKYMLDPGKTNIGISGSYYTFTPAIPCVRTSFGWKINKNNYIEGSVSYGGYRGFDGGIKYECNILDRINFSVATDNLGILFNKEMSYGQGILFSINSFF
jgi:hypothetical protein